MSYLPYISDTALKNAVQKVVDSIKKAQVEEENNLYKNVIDPFSAIFDGVVLDLTLEEWLTKEKERQVQKTIQNKIGEFHQNILGSITGWENLGTGKGVDIRNQSRKIIAEVKNKHNTVKKSNLYVIYNDLSKCLENTEYQGFTAYYVEILPETPTAYDEAFQPPIPNTDGRKKPFNEKIRRISGQAFYNLATGVPGSLSMLFDVLPDVISEVTGIDRFTEEQKTQFRRLFDRAY